MHHQFRCSAFRVFKMADPIKAMSCCGLGRILIIFTLTNVLTVDFSSGREHYRRSRDLGVSGMVHFNNPKLLKDVDPNLWTDDDWLKDRRQESLDPNKIGGIIITKEARRLYLKLRKITNEELGVTAMQGIFDSLPFMERTASEENQLLELTKRIETKFHQYLRVLSSNKLTVENLYRFHAKLPIVQKFDCCNLLDQDLRSENQYHCKVSRLTTCDLIPRNVPHGAFNPGRNLTQVFQHNVQYFPNLKWQYFISIDGVHNEYPAHNFQMAPMDCRSVHNIRHRDVFVSTVQPQRKHVVIMMDHGMSLSDNQLATAKAIAKHIISSLSENDRVGIIGLSSKVTYPRMDGCLSKKLAPLTYEAKFFFMDFIDSLMKQDTSTDHTLGFIKAFGMIRNSLATANKTSSDEAMIMYVSRGLLSALTDAKEVLKSIALENGRMEHRVVINTYAVIDDGKPIMYEKSFLQDVADQNFKKYDVPLFSNNPIIRGQMIPINTTRDLSFTVGQIFKPFNRSTVDLPHFSLPYMDVTGQGLIISITQPSFHNGRVVGISGIDLHLGDLVEDVTYYDNDRSAYSFLINTDGYIIMHPSMSRPVNSHHQPMHTDIKQYENYPGFEKIRNAMLTEEEGKEILYIPRNETSESLYLPGTGDTIKAKYLWKKVPEVPMIVCLKVMTEDLKRRDLKNVRISTSPDIISYRLDILPSDKNCMHLKTLSTPEASTMYLSPMSFIDPFKHLMETETKKMVQGYLAYLKDETKLIANPGLKTEIRSDATALARINSVWLKQYKMSYLNDYIVRRYVATPSGVFRMYPGTLMHNNYAPDKRPWYTRAMEYPGRVTLTAPYLDAGGAGYIVTMSHTVYEGKAAAMHTRSDRVVATMGIDFTLRFMYKLLIEAIPNCAHPNIRCFVFDDKGYLIAHPGLIEPNGKGPVEMQHITHMEPLVANDILNHRHFVKKTLCNSYSDRTIQRYYHFNTSLDGVLTNLVHGEHCSKYQITSIPDTNTFLGIVNQTCNMITAFCPCSMVDRLCLNCHRMEQSECECPCECPLDMDFCTGSLLDEEDKNPSCPSYPEAPVLQSVPVSVSEGLPQCYKRNCALRRTKDECFGVIDCEWCQLDFDGRTPLSEPYCATQRVCFGGVYGAISPYSDEIKLLAQHDEQHAARTTPVGPVAGGIMGCFLVLALAVYCYRHHVHRNSHQYITSIPDTQVRMSQLDNEQEDIEPHEEPGSGHTNFVLASFENAASISPYRVNTMYRRPAGGDSDHGYSTMTPHEDSEQASTTCIEPLIVGKDRYKPSAYITKAPAIPPPPSSTTRRSRSPTPPQTRLPTHHTVIPEQHAIGPMTVLPESSHHNPHHIIANVQVHMVDTH